MARPESSLMTAAYVGLFLTAMTIGLALYVWPLPRLFHHSLLLAVGMMGTVPHICIGQAFGEAEVAPMLPINFSRLIIASVIGYLISTETPGIWT